MQEKRSKPGSQATKPQASPGESARERDRKRRQAKALRENLQRRKKPAPASPAQVD